MSLSLIHIYSRGFHLITRDIVSQLPALPESGLLVVFIKHTSACLLYTSGTYEVFIDDADGWTVCTDDGLPSAQWENMILITETGNEILTY